MFQCFGIDISCLTLGGLNQSKYLPLLQYRNIRGRKFTSPSWRPMGVYRVLNNFTLMSEAVPCQKYINTGSML
jgi:hypothetical protein